jgi:hypothetical protein
MSTLQITLGLPGFAAAEIPKREARIDMRHFNRSGAKLRGVEIRNGRLTGHDSGGTEHEVGRSIAYDLNGSRHKCNSSCQHAKGADCECACGGINHGKAWKSGARLFI